MWQKKKPSEEQNNKKPLTLQNLKHRTSIVQTNKPDIPVEYMHTYKLFLWLFFTEEKQTKTQIPDSLETNQGIPLPGR